MRILVVGAGIAGLTFVRALHYFHSSSECLNCSVEMVERATAFKDGVGIVLHPNGLRVIDSIGLLEELLPFTNIIDRIQTDKNSAETTIDLQDVWGAGNHTRTVLRKELHNLLASHLIKPSAIPLNMRLGCCVESVLQKNTETIVHFDNGDSAAYDLVVAADGVHSRIREMLFPNTPAISTNLFYFRFIAQNHLDIRTSIWKVFEREDASYGFIPLAGNLVHCFIQLQTTVSPCLKEENEFYLERVITSWDPLLSIALSKRCSSIQSGFAYMVPPGNWSIGNTVLMGDASHAVSPTLSEGGSLAMEDALVLALSLYGSASIQEAIVLYQQAREERCNRAYRMALFQLNSLRKPRRNESAQTDVVNPTQLMRGMYKSFLEDPLSPYLQSFLTRLKSGKITNDLLTN